MRLAYNPNLPMRESYVAIYRIYVLIDPYTHEIFYVGQTVNNLETRLSGHINGGNSNYKKNAYIQEIIAKGRRPEIKQVEAIACTCFIDKVLVNERELFWIKYYKDRGYTLYNISGVDTDFETTDYKDYLRSIKAGETKWHYYYCGVTIGGVKVYDANKMLADGFVFTEKEQDTELTTVQQLEQAYKNKIAGVINEYDEKLSQLYRLIPKTIETEVFPTPLAWTSEFSAGIVYSDEDEYSYWDEINETDDYDLEDDELEGEYLENDLADFEEGNDDEISYITGTEDGI